MVGVCVYVWFGFLASYQLSSFVFFPPTFICARLEEICARIKVFLKCTYRPGLPIVCVCVCDSFHGVC